MNTACGSFDSNLDLNKRKDSPSMQLGEKELQEINARIAALPEDQRLKAQEQLGEIEGRDCFFFYLGKIAGLDRMLEGFQEAMTLGRTNNAEIHV